MVDRNVAYTIPEYRRMINRVTLMRVALFIGMVLMIRALVIWGSLYKAQNIDESKDPRTAKVLSLEKKGSSPYPPIKIKKLVRIQIVNHTGTITNENEIVNALVESGYSLSNIEFQNGEVLKNTGTTITSHADFEEIVAHIKTVLRTVTPEIADGIQNNNPNRNSTFDVVIITDNRETNTVMSTQDP